MRSAFARPVRVLTYAAAGQDAARLADSLELAALPAEVIALEEGEDLVRRLDEGAADVAIVNVDALELTRARALIAALGRLDTKVPVIALADVPAADLGADYVFARPPDEAGFLGLVAAIKFYWMSAAPSLRPPAPAVSVRPRPIAGVDVMALPIDPVEAYLLSQIDGELSLDEIAQVVGASSKDTRRMLRRLADLGAVQWSPPHPSLPPVGRSGSWSAYPSLPAPPPPDSAPPDLPLPPGLSAPPDAADGDAPVADALGDAAPGDAAPGDAAPGDPAPGDPAPGDAAPGDAAPGDAAPGDAAPGDAAPGDAAPSDPAPGDAVPGDAAPGDAVPGGAAPGDAAARLDATPADAAAADPEARGAETESGSRRRLDEARRRAVDESHSMVEAGADHYELLGVAHDATRGDIRDAYFRLAKLFHTDTLYGQDLGEYGRRMDNVFQAVTEAYEVLSRKNKRRAYDAYLAAYGETSELDDVVMPSAPPAPPLEPARRIEPTLPVSSIALAPTERLLRRPSEAQRKRLAERFAKSLGRAAPGPGRAHAPGRVGPKVSNPEATVRSLAKVLTQVSSSSGRGDRATQLIEDAREAERRGNLTGAASALRLAARWRPDDADLARESARVHGAAVQAKLAQYRQRARYAQERGRWDEAALCWGRVASASPDDLDAARAAAEAQLRGRVDLGEGVRHARRLAGARPDDARAHRLLGELFVAAGKPASARTALLRARELDGADRVTKELLKELG